MTARLHIITDFIFQQRFSHGELAEMAIRAGADAIQFRQKHGGIRHRLREATDAHSIASRAGVTFIVNDDGAIAHLLPGAGLHVGQEDLPVQAARALLGNDRIVGATANSITQALAAEAAGADYIGYGPIFRTSSKANPAPVQGISHLKSVCERVAIPVIAIGGINPDRVGDIIDAGAHGIAVLSSVSMSPDPGRAVSEFRSAIDDAVAKD